MSNIYLPEQFKIVSGVAGIVTTNGGVTSDIVDLKNVHMAWIVVTYLQAATHATVLTPVTGISIASCATAITFAANWWKNADISATDTLVAQTAATTMSATLGVANQLLVIQIDPSDIVAQLGTYHCLGFTVATSGEATNFMSANFFLQYRYPQSTPATAIV